MAETPHFTNPEDAYLDNIPDDVLARLEKADRAVDLSRSPGLSTLTPVAQQSLLDHILNTGQDDNLSALLQQTKREIGEGIFDVPSLRPDLRALLIPGENDEQKP